MIDPARHQALREQLVDLAIDALPPGEAREVEAHAAGCPACRAELASLRGVTEQAAALPPIEAPARGEAILLAAARQAADQARSKRRLGLPPWFWTMALGGAGAAAVVVLALQLTSGAKGPLDAASREVPAPETAPAGARDTIAPAAPALAQAEAKKELAPAPATLAPAPRAAVAQEAEAPARRDELRAEPAPRKRERLAGAGAQPRELDAPPPAAPPAAPSVQSAQSGRSAEAGAAAKAASGPGAIGFSAAPDGPPAPEQALAKAARAPAPAALREEAAGNLADAATPAPPRPAAAAQAAERRASSSGLAAPAPRPETRTDTGCAAEQRRTLWRDGAGAVVRRLRAGLLHGAPVAVEETFGFDGRVVSARVEAGGRTSVFGRGGLEAAGFVPVPGLRVAPTAAEAERDPPACDAWPR